jgi:hypothetical protein
LRTDTFQNEVIAKCDLLKKARFWPSEPKMRPRAWLNNFDESDRHIAAKLLDKFTYYNSETTEALLRSSFHSIGDGLPKGPDAPSGSDLVSSLSNAVLTPVTGEEPNPSDSGGMFCRYARQVLKIPQEVMFSTENAIEHAEQGRTIVFIDDFVGSGDQFLETWWRNYNGKSFASLQNRKGFVAVYITLLATDLGVRNIYVGAPKVAVCPAHILTETSSVKGLISSGFIDEGELDIFLRKYSAGLTPTDDYMNNPDYKAYGYKRHGLLFGFEHSIPDLSLPIFWSTGNNWEPLIERS